MKVKELIALLQGHADQESPVRVCVGWAGDTAHSDASDELDLSWYEEDGKLAVVVTGWMSNCDTQLEYKEAGEL